MNSKSIGYTNKEVDLLVKQLLPLVLRIEKDFTHGVAIYGAGFVGTWASQYLRSMGAKVDFFIDRDAQKDGSVIDGVPVILPTNHQAFSAPSVFIAARHAVKSVSEIFINSNSKSISFDGYYVIKNYERLAKIRDNFFSDERSVEVYNALLIAMLTGTVDSCRAVMEKDMYFALPEFSGTFDEIFVDAGAFVGDTVERFIWENLGTFRHIYAFEPGAKQFTALQKRIVRLSEEWAFTLDRVSLVKAGLSSTEGSMTCSFVDDFPLRHGLVESKCIINHQSVDVYPLDSYLEGKPVTFIKADVEGMETALLNGAKNTIQQFKPKMALCVYHYPSDLFEIAEYVRLLVPEYKFSLRQHAPIFGDFVLYCYIG